MRLSETLLVAAGLGAVMGGAVPLLFERWKAGELVCCGSILGAAVALAGFHLGAAVVVGVVIAQGVRYALTRDAGALEESHERRDSGGEDGDDQASHHAVKDVV